MDMICKACGNTMARLVEDLYICSDCTLISSDIMPDPSIYDKSYVLKYQRYEKTDTGKDINACRFDALPIDGPILDYGCGVGSFVKHCNIHGVEAYGYDINPYGAFCDPTALLRKYRAVTFWDSIEHIANPGALISGLSPDYLCISTPDTDDFTGKKSDITRWRHYMPEEHVHYFNERSLTALLGSLGYTVMRVHHEESQYRTGGGDKNIITIIGGKIGTD